MKCTILSLSFTHTQAQTHTRTHTHARTHARTHTHTHKHTHTHTHTNSDMKCAPRQDSSRATRGTPAEFQAGPIICMYECAYMRVCIVYMCVCVVTSFSLSLSLSLSHTHTHTHTHPHTHTLPHFLFSLNLCLPLCQRSGTQG